MDSKKRNILNWVLAALVAFIFISSATMKLTGSPEVLKMAEGFGFDKTTFTLIAIVELVSVVLFLIPRTGVLGTLLLAAYMGGAIVTHLSHGDSIVTVCIIQAFVWIVAIIRFPELINRFLGKTQAV